MLPGRFSLPVAGFVPEDKSMFLLRTFVFSGFFNVYCAALHNPANLSLGHQGHFFASFLGLSLEIPGIRPYY
jgi:hypothetical protein